MSSGHYNYDSFQGPLESTVECMGFSQTENGILEALKNRGPHIDR